VPSVSLMLVPEVSEVPSVVDLDVPRETPSDRPSVQPRDSPSVRDFVQLLPSDCCLNCIWDVFCGSQKTGFISHNADGNYSYLDLTRGLHGRENVTLDVLDHEDAFNKTKQYLAKARGLA
jgi:hypothetical protein